MLAEQRKGTAAGFACYLLWGFMPLYWKLMQHVDSFEIIAHRVIWCMAFAVAVCLITRRGFLRLFKDSRARRILIPASLVIMFNWSVYIYAVNAGHVVETAIGYYINPLITVLFGVLFFKEKLSRLQTIALCLCAVGIVFFTCNYGEFPWFAVALALSFALYGAIKKKGGYPAVESIAVENVTLFIPAVVLAAALAMFGNGGAFMGDTATVSGWTTTFLLVGGGFLTAIPLILFATAANNIPLTMLGFLQYISPTVGLLLGVFAFGEAFTTAHAVCFGCIWTGLALVTIDAMRK